MRHFRQASGWLPFWSGVAVVAITFGAACGEGGMSAAEALAKADADAAAAAAAPATPPDPNKERPTGKLPPPSEAEFEAWNRKDPEGEKHLYKWDKAHLKDMLGYWEDLTCFREKIKAEGEAAAAALPGSPEAEQFYQYKRAFKDHLDRWQQRLFAEQARVLESSKMVGDLLAAHELVLYHYPKAYNPRDEVSLKEADLQWARIELKLKKYVKSLGSELPQWSPDDKRTWSKHERACEAALKPPKAAKSR